MSRVVRFHHPVLIDLMREMNNPIKFSVTVPAYKAQFLKECIDSILAQTYQNFELIIVNDASPQDLDSIVAQYHDPRIRYYKNKVGFGAEHVVGNWNKCLEYATGDYLICMGDDDKLLPNCLEEYVKLIDLIPGLDLYHGMTEIINQESKIISIQEPRPLWESAYSMLWWRWCGRSQYIGDWLFKTESLKKENGFYSTSFAWGADDASAFLSAFKKGVANTFKPVFQYRISNLTISKNTDNVLEKIASKNIIFDNYKNLIDKQPTDSVDKVYWSLISKNLDKYHEKFISYDISEDIISHPFHIGKWIFKIGSNNITKRAFLYSVFLCMKYLLRLR